MTYSGENFAEHMVPLTSEAVDRIRGFYQEIGWTVSDSDEGRLIAAVPETGLQPVEGISYWQTETHHKTVWFERFDDPDDPSQLSEYTQGIRLPRLMDLIERPLVLPTDDDVLSVIEDGGELLRKHTHTPLQVHYGRPEFRFSDPFLYGVRVTGPKSSELK
jgi:hypothetical protein